MITLIFYAGVGRLVRIARILYIILALALIPVVVYLMRDLLGNIFTFMGFFARRKEHSSIDPLSFGRWDLLFGFHDPREVSDFGNQDVRYASKHSQYDLLVFEPPQNDYGGVWRRESATVRRVGVCFRISISKIPNQTTSVLHVSMANGRAKYSTYLNVTPDLNLEIFDGVERVTFTPKDDFLVFIVDFVTLECRVYDRSFNVIASLKLRYPSATNVIEYFISCIESNGRMYGGVWDLEIDWIGILY